MSGPDASQPRLSLLISEASNLRKKDIFGLSDPYVKISLHGSSTHQVIASTPTIKKTLHPKWDKEVHFDVPRKAFSIILDVYDENILTRDDFLGRTILHFDLSVVSSPEYSLTAANDHQCGVRVNVTKNLHNKYSTSNLDGYLRLPHVREMERTFTSSKNFSRNSDMNKNWGTIKLSYVIHDANSPSTSGESLPYPTNEPHPQTRQSGSGHHGEESDSDSETELPSGWDRRVDSNGRRLYVNHRSHQASLRRPQQHRILLREERLQETTSTQQGEGVETVGWESGGVGEDQHHHSRGDGSDESVSSELGLRRYLERSHSVDAIVEQQGQLEESLSVELPPNPDEISILQPFATLALADQDVSLLSQQQQQQNTTSSGSVSGTSYGAAVPSTSQGASCHPPQLSTALQRASQDLPSNWGASMTPTGRIYYINHNTQTTTWEKPRYKEVKATPGPSAAPVEQDSDLPDGWEARKDQKGQTYYVDHERKLTTWLHPKIAPQIDDLGPMPSGWETKQMEDGRMFFVDHRTHSTQWEDPRLLAKNKPTAKIQYSRDYKQKYANFRSKLTPKHNIPRQFEIPCRRDFLFEDTYNVIMNVRDVEMLKARLYVIFEGESGLDYGGVAREWIHLLSHAMFNPYYGLFEYSASDDYTLQINPDSKIYNDVHLNYFRFIGRICGMAVYHNRLIDAFFIRSFYKMMLNKPITLEDMQAVDVELWNSFTYILENDPEPLCLDFTVTKTIFDEVIQVDLKPNGESIPVTESNKKEYIDLLIKWRFSDRVCKQMDAFLEGFADLVPLRLIKVFDERELEYLMGGLAQIDVEDWKRNTEYTGYNATEQVIQWFWKAVENYDGEMRARLLQFVTGTSKVPMNGFSELQGSQGPRKFCINKYGNPFSLPRAHTCFNRIDLPPYPSYHKLKEMLRVAVENTEGFEGVD